MSDYYATMIPDSRWTSQLFVVYADDDSSRNQSNVVVYAADEVSSLFVELASILPLAQMKAANRSDSTVEKGPATGSPSRGPAKQQKVKPFEQPPAGDTRNQGSIC